MSGAATASNDRATTRYPLDVYLGGPAPVSAALAVVCTAIPWFFFVQAQPVGRVFGYLFGAPLAVMAIGFGLAGLVQAVRSLYARSGTLRRLALLGAALCVASLLDGSLLVVRVLPG